MGGGMVCVCVCVCVLCVTVICGRCMCVVHDGDL